MSFVLVVNDGTGSGQSFSYTKERISIGRLKENDLVLCNTGVSRTHCVITEKAPGKYFIEDVGSSNGTIVNGQKITGEVRLRDGDNIIIGPAAFIFKKSDAAASGANEHYEESGADDTLSNNSGATQAIDKATVQRLLKQGAAGNAQNSSQPAAPAAPEAAAAEARPRRVTGQRRVPQNLDEAAAGAETSKEAAAPQQPGKRVTGDPARRARLAEAKKEAEMAKNGEKEVQPIKEVTAKVQPRKPFKVWWGEQDKKKKIIIIGAVSLVFLLLVGVVVKKGGSAGAAFADYSDKIFPINPTNSKKSFGLGKGVSYNCPDKANFSFDYQGGLVVLRYSVAGINLPTEVAIYINDVLAGYAPLTNGNSYISDIRFKIPTNLLKPHNRNIITFDSTLNPPKSEKWAVRQVTVEEKPLPEADPERAMQLYTLAQDAYKSYLVDPANLSTAIGHYNDAQLYLEKLDPKPPLYGQIEVSLKEAEEALKEIYDTNMFKSYKAIRSKDYDEAREILNELLRYLPNQEDERRKEVLDKLKSLGQGV